MPEQTITLSDAALSWMADVMVGVRVCADEQPWSPRAMAIGSLSLDDTYRVGWTRGSGRKVEAFAASTRLLRRTSCPN